MYKLYKGAWIWDNGPHLEERLSGNDLHNMLSRGGLFVRNTYNFDCNHTTSFWYVIKDSFGGIQDVPSKYRGRVKKALASFDIKIVDKEYLLKNGYDVYLQAAQNYKVTLQPPSFESFAERINKMDENYDLWACVHKETGKMAAFAINHLIDNTVDYQTMKFHPDFLANLHPSYGLIYEMNRYYLEEKGVLFVNDGARTLTNHSDVQPFLMQKFKFRKAYCDLLIKYKPWLGLLVRLLFPFRRIIKNRKLVALLYQEAMARGYE